MGETQEQGTKMYTDQELCWAAHIAYCNVDKFDMQRYIKDKPSEYPTLQQVFEEIGYEIYYDQKLMGAKNLSGDELKMQESAKQFIDDIRAGRICQGWKLVSVCNQNKTDGMYGLTIETSDQDAIIAFRGSEATNPKQIIEDWVSADFNIMSGELTHQEESALQYLDKVANQFDYSNFAVTGHSLGGDLALVSTVLSASDKSESDISTRIRQSVSFDGPGHPEEFIAEYQEEISEMQGVMTHYHWSLVGACLKSLCQDPLNSIWVRSDSFESSFAKHALQSLEFNEDGSLPRTGEADDWAITVCLLTNIIDLDDDTQRYVSQTVKSAEETARFACFIAGSLYAGGVMINNLLCKRPDSRAVELEKILEKCRVNALSGAQTGIKLREFFQTCLDEWKKVRQETLESEMEKIDSSKAIELWLKVTSENTVLFDILSQYNTFSEKELNIIQAAFIAGLTGGHIGNDTSIPMGDWVTEPLADTEADYMEVKAVRALPADPLVVDLDGDGFELLPVEKGVYFDENQMGLKEKTQWAAPDDALLAIDLNGDGMINDGSELFGTSTLLKDGTLAESGFEALAQQDENGDGIVDINDSGFSKLLVWQDKNSDGISQQDELHTLEELGIESISLNYRNADGINTADITLADGTTTQIGEFDFDARLYDSMEKEEVEISEEIKGLPNIRAIGNVASLHTLMQMDDTGNLKEYVTQFTQADSIGEREEIVTKILYFITGAGEIAVGSRGGQFDAQKLVVIEQFLGKDFVGTAGRNPVNTAVGMLNGIYDNIFELYYNLLNGQTTLKDCLSMAVWTTDENGGRYLNTQIFNAYIDSCISEGMDMTNVVAEMGRYIVSVNSGNKINFADYVNAYSGKSDYLKAITEASKKSVISGTEENDMLNANGNRSFLVGLEGNDTLNGGTSNDFLYGGTGNDYLEGGSGNDTYFFELGDGNDTIQNYDREGWRNDRILFGEGISPEDMRVSRQGNSMVLENEKSGDRVTVNNAFMYGDGSSFMGKVEFSDGIAWEPEDIREMLRTFRGTEGNDTLSGFDNGYNYDLNETFYGEGGNDTINAGGGDDLLYGGEGDDILYGWAGDDFLNGGSGNDRLDGGTGSDTYFFGLGDGQDTITDYDTTKDNSDTLCMNVEAEKLQFSRIGADLLVSILGTDDSVTIKNWYYGDSYHVENIQSSDGYSLAHTQIDQMIQAMASFEDVSGMSWQEAVAAEDDTVNQLVSQMWVKQGA